LIAFSTPTYGKHERKHTVQIRLTLIVLLQHQRPMYLVPDLVLAILEVAGVELLAAYGEGQRERERTAVLFNPTIIRSPDEEDAGLHSGRVPALVRQCQHHAWPTCRNWVGPGLEDASTRGARLELLGGAQCASYDPEGVCSHQTQVSDEAHLMEDLGTRSALCRGCILPCALLFLQLNVFGENTKNEYGIFFLRQKRFVFFHLPLNSNAMRALC
jgi:hypothetical protein